MADDPYISGPKSRKERKSEAKKDEAPDRRKNHRKWYEILSDTIVPGKFAKGLVEDSARKAREAAKK